MANLISKICTKLYQNRSHFVKDNNKKILVCFQFAVPTVVHLQNTNAKMHKVV